MSRKLTKELEQRLREVVKSKIRRLREAPAMPDEEEEEDEMMSDPTVDGTDSEFDVSGTPEEMPSDDMAGEEPSSPPVGFSKEPDSQPSDIPDSEAGDDSPPIDSQSGADSLRQAKTKLFFDKLAANPMLMDLLNFKSPLEQAEAINYFAELVGVPKSQVLPLLKQIKDKSMEPQTDPTVESFLRREYKKKMQETKFLAFYNRKKIEIEADSLYDAKQKAIAQLRVPKSKVGLLAVVNADEHAKGNSYRFN
jgi:hypothetical protein